jgi:hypothetical protein
VDEPDHGLARQPESVNWFTDLSLSGDSQAEPLFLALPNSAIPLCGTQHMGMLRKTPDNIRARTTQNMIRRDRRQH